MEEKPPRPGVPLGKHRLPPLPYPYDALAPVLGAATLKLHHDKHHKAYVDGLNKAELALADARCQRDFAFVSYWENELAYNGSGHILHSIYWAVMAPPDCGGEPGPCVRRELERAFGGIGPFRDQLVNAAVKVQASGWGILAWNPAWGRLEILTAEKHQNLAQWGSIPVLVLDVWEHAYYLDYRNERERYVREWLKLVDWCEVENRLLLAMQGDLPLLATARE
jgi:Fe-Mn family superoxide dismutase